MMLNSISLHHLSIPLKRTFSTTTNTLSEIQCLVTGIQTQDGFTAQSFIYGLGKVAIPEVMLYFHSELLSDINSKKAWDNPQSWKSYWAQLRSLPVSPPLQFFISALDVAAWDYFAKRANMPLHRYLGSTVSEMPLYGTTGWLSLSTKELIAEAQKYAEQGIMALKVRCPHPQDKERIEALRKAMGSEFKIMIDATACLNLEEATHLATELAPYDITWLEEPLKNMSELKALCAKTDIPIAAGENFLTEAEFASFSQAGQLKIYQIDLKRMGGVTGFIHAGNALKGKVPVSNHLMPELCIGLLSVFPNATLAEYDDLLPSEIFTCPPVIKAGRFQISDEPGTGVYIKPEALDAYKACRTI